jgi:hypothetical protein
MWEVTPALESLDNTASTTYVDVVESWGANPFNVTDYPAREAAGDYLEVMLQFYEAEGHGQYALRYDGTDYQIVDSTGAVDGYDLWPTQNIHNSGWISLVGVIVPVGIIEAFTLRYKWDGVTGTKLDISGPTRLWWRFRGSGSEVYLHGEIDISPDWKIPLWRGAGNWTYCTAAANPDTFTLVGTDDLVICDCTAGEVILNLPSSIALGQVAGEPYGKQYKIKKRDATANVITVKAITGWAGGDDFIDEASATYTLSNEGESVHIQTDSNHHWWVVASHLHP